MSDILDKLVEVLQEAVEDFEIKIEKGTDNSAEIHRQTVARLEKRLRELQELEIKQWDEKTRGGMPDHVFERLNAKTVAEIREVTQALCEAKDSAPVHVDLREKLITFRTALEMLNDPDAPALEVNQLLRTCIDRIDYSRPPLKRGRGVVNEPFSLHFSLRV
jgi:iron-sulfur cluster repair protein YtfE (RIC family)